MAFLRTSLSSEPEPELRGRGVHLRVPAMTDYPMWQALRTESRAHLTPWEPLWTVDELSRPSYRRRLRHYQREEREDSGYAYFLFREPDNALLGGVTLSNVRRGVSQAAYLGYWIGAAYAGRGLMTEAVRTLLPYAFETLRLHRLEAACLPTNGPSIRVLEKSGFTLEGMARRYLKINGVWQDHKLFAILSDDRRREVPA